MEHPQKISVTVTGSLQFDLEIDLEDVLAPGADPQAARDALFDKARRLLQARKDHLLELIRRDIGDVASAMKQECGTGDVSVTFAPGAKRINLSSSRQSN